MPDRQLVLSFPLDDYDWLRACAEADGCSVSDVVRRCVVFAKQSCEESVEAEPTMHEIGQAYRRQQEEEKRREAEARAAAIAQKRAELEALMLGEEPPPPAAQFYTPAPGQPPQMGKPSVLDMDLSREPRAEEMEIPPDPDDGGPYHANVVSSGQRPGAATRPAGVNPEIAVGLRSGDALGNVIRANYAHLNFSRGRN